MPAKVGVRLAPSASALLVAPTVTVSLTAVAAVLTEKVTPLPETVDCGRAALMAVPLTCPATALPLTRNMPETPVNRMLVGSLLKAAVALVAEMAAIAAVLPPVQLTAISKLPARRTPPAASQPLAETVPVCPGVSRRAARVSALAVSLNWKSMPPGSAAAVRLSLLAP